MPRSSSVQFNLESDLVCLTFVILDLDQQLLAESRQPFKGHGELAEGEAE